MWSDNALAQHFESLFFCRHNQKFIFLMFLFLCDCFLYSVRKRSDIGREISSYNLGFSVLIFSLDWDFKQLGF